MRQPRTQPQGRTRTVLVARQPEGLPFGEDNGNYEVLEAGDVEDRRVLVVPDVVLVGDGPVLVPRRVAVGDG